MKYIGRKEELKLLNEKYSSDKFEFGYIYGQRRIGKTTLIEMFARDKKALLLYPTDSADISILSSFSETLNSLKGIVGAPYPTWFDFFKAVDDYFKNEKGVMIIDEYPNIVLNKDGKRKNTDFQSSLQKAIDLLFKNRKFTLILTGSNVSFIEKEIGDYFTPLYQRNTFSLLVKKFEFNEALEVLSSIKDNFLKAKILSLTNTFPYYLTLIDQNKDFNEILDDLFYKRNAIFIDDPSKIITSYKASGGFYSSILYGIVNGKNNLKDIAIYLNEDTTFIYPYIKELLNDDILIKKTTFMSTKKVYFEISDPMLAFFYRFIRENVDLIRSGYGKIIKEKQKNAIKEFIEHYFEKLCITYLEYLSKNGFLNGYFFYFSNYKIENSPLNRSIEIDIVSSDENNLLIGETKFSKTKRTIKDYYLMKEDVSVPPFSSFKNKEFYLFGANGFDEKLLEINDSSLHLIDLEKMFNLK